MQVPHSASVTLCFCLVHWYSQGLLQACCLANTKQFFIFLHFFSLYFVKAYKAWVIIWLDVQKLMERIQITHPTHLLQPEIFQKHKCFENTTFMQCFGLFEISVAPSLSGLSQAFLGMLMVICVHKRWLYTSL